MRGKVTYFPSKLISDTGNNQDDVETINLPFTFWFYGPEYDQISISSNGWIRWVKPNLGVISKL